MTTINIEQNKQEFISRFNKYIGHRVGASELLDFITSSKRDFFIAPATANDVLAVSGGSCRYALLLHDAMMEMFSSGVFSHAMKLNKDVTEEAIAVVTLLSALDNIMTYVTEYKNRKSHDPAVIERLQAQGEAVKMDSAGPFVWETYQAYSYDDSMPLGDGVRAISFIQAFMPLNKAELLALRWGRTTFASGHDKGALWSSLNKSILAVALQNAHNTVRFLLANEDYQEYFSNLYGVSSSMANASTPRYDDSTLPFENATKQHDDSTTTVVDDELPFEPVKEAAIDVTPQTSHLEQSSQPEVFNVSESNPSVSDFDLSSLIGDLSAMDKAMFG